LAFYIPDFYCASEKLTIELDGKVHLYRKEKDAFRDNILNSFGLKVLRIKNEELATIEMVLKKIRNEFVSYTTSEQDSTPPTPL
jgi:very-short-patch-repair endonuclease